MRRVAIISLAAILLAACNQPAPQASAGSPVEDAAAPPVDSPTLQATAPAAFNAAFPAGFEPTFKYSIRSRKTEETADGRVRKLVIEYKEGDATTVDAQIEAALLAKGFKRYKNEERENDLLGDYGNAGKRVTAYTSRDAGPLQLAADSKGTVYFVWKE